jgi:hypothetical protein
MLRWRGSGICWFATAMASRHTTTVTTRKASRRAGDAAAAVGTAAAGRRCRRHRTQKSTPRTAREINTAPIPSVDESRSHM